MNLFFHHGDGINGVEWRVVGSLSCHGIVGISDGYDSCHGMDLIAFELLRVSISDPRFVMFNTASFDGIRDLIIFIEDH